MRQNAVEFCRACIEMNTIDELQDGHIDKISMYDWDITLTEYNWAIETAIKILKNPELDIDNIGV